MDGARPAGQCVAGHDDVGGLLTLPTLGPVEPQSPLQQPEPAVTEPRRRRWGLGDFLLGLLAGYSLATLAVVFWVAVTGDEDLNLAGQAFSQVGLWTGMVGAAVF